MTPRRSVWPWFAGAFGLLILDQGTKALVRQNFDLHESIPLLGQDLLRLTYVLNPGIAFGFRFLSVHALLIFGWIAAAVLAVFMYRLARRGDVLRWPVMLFLAGAVGNSIDRLVFGQVTDFIDADFPDFIMERWAVFNVADSCVTIGILLLVIQVLFHRDPQPHSASAEPHVPIPAKPDSLSTDDRSGPGTAAD